MRDVTDMSFQNSEYAFRMQARLVEGFPVHVIDYVVLPDIKVSVTVRGVGMFMRLFEKSYKV